MLLILELSIDVPNANEKKILVRLNLNRPLTTKIRGPPC